MKRTWYILFLILAVLFLWLGLYFLTQGLAQQRANEAWQQRLPLEEAAQEAAYFLPEKEIFPYA